MTATHLIFSLAIFTLAGFAVLGPILATTWLFCLLREHGFWSPRQESGLPALAKE